MLLTGMSVCPAVFRRIRPLQALIVLNDPVYQEAAEAMARLVAKEADAKVGSDANHPLDARLIYERSWSCRVIRRRVIGPTPRFFSLKQSACHSTRHWSEPACMLPRPARSFTARARWPNGCGQCLTELDAALTR